LLRGRQRRARAAALGGQSLDLFGLGQRGAGGQPLVQRVEFDARAAGGDVIFGAQQIMERAVGAGRQHLAQGGPVLTLEGGESILVPAPLILGEQLGHGGMRVAAHEIIGGGGIGERRIGRQSGQGRAGQGHASSDQGRARMFAQAGAQASVSGH
jgi:hypothetical protein